MDTYVWWDSEDEDTLISDPFEAVDFESAIDKAIWLFMGDIGEQLEYELPIAVQNKDTGEIRKLDVRVEYGEPSFYKAEQS